MNEESKKLPAGEKTKLKLNAPRSGIVLKKPVEEGSIKQSFPHGRTKRVAVEVRRKKTMEEGQEQGQGEHAVHESRAPATQQEGRESSGRGATSPPPRGRQQVLKPLSPEERAAFAEAMELRRRVQEEQERKQAELARRQAEERARKAEELAAKRESEGLPPMDEAAAAIAAQAEEERAAQAEATEPEGVGSEPREEGAAVEEEAAVEGVAGEEGEEGEDDGKGGAKKKLSRAQREDVARRKAADLVERRLAEVEVLRQQKKLDDQRRLMEAEAEETLGRGRGGSKKKEKKLVVPEEGARGQGRRGKRPRDRDMRRVEQPPPGPVVREVIIPETINVGELANRMAVKSSEVIRLLFNQGIMATVNQVIDQDTAILVVEEMGHKAKPVSVEALIDIELAESVDTFEEKITRSPVVTVMGHVDHGKTSLLDAIRKTDVTSREFGGITQHIGAYQVVLDNGARITFLDTPGHAAFTAMRSRGAKVTDVVVLVVAADDGVMPQTIEAVNHAKAAGVPIVVAVNKIDKPDANPEKVMQQLTEHGLVSEEWGGETIFAKVSAKTGEGLPELLEMILVQSEVLDLKANPTKRARGVIVEAKLDKGRGPVATCLVQSGTLRVGDYLVAGTEWGKVRILFNDKGESLESAGPSVPVEIIGMSGVPEAGDDFVVLADERRTRDIAEFRQRKAKEKLQVQKVQTTLGDIFQQIQQGELEEVKVVIKADVRGSAEAVAEALQKIVHKDVRVVVIHSGVGGINESDVMLAAASKALVVGFNVRAGAEARMLSEREGIDIRFYNVIYDLVDDIKKAMEGLLRPTLKEKVLGRAVVRQVFRIGKVGNIAGCMMSEGIGQRDAKIRLLRNESVVFEGMLSSLKHFKDDVKEVREGIECGIALERFQDIKPGDVVEFYTQEEVRQTIGG